MEITTPRPDLEQVIKLYGSFLPDYDYLMRTFGANNGWIRFSPRLQELSNRFNCNNYPELYQDETRIQTALLRAFFDDDEKMNQFITDFSSRTSIEQTVFMNKFISDSQKFGQWLDENVIHLDDLDWSPYGQAKARQKYEKFSVETQQKTTRTLRYLLVFSLASFYNFIALMVHGRKLTQLVKEAMTGNDDSFCLAVHIDRNILEQIPYFKDRNSKAQREGDQNFLDALSYRIRSPQIKGKIRHRALYMLFAILESTQWLDVLTRPEILDICDQLNLDHYENRIETEKALADRLRDYRKFQRMNSMSTL
jgi:hypothetical protein